MLLNWYSSMKKKIEKDSYDFWHGNLSLKVKFWHFFDTSPLHQFAKFNAFIWLQLIFSQKTFLILYPSNENSTTGIAIDIILQNKKKPWPKDCGLQKVGLKYASRGINQREVDFETVLFDTYVLVGFWLLIWIGLIMYTAFSNMTLENLIINELQ